MATQSGAAAARSRNLLVLSSLALIAALLVTGTAASETSTGASFDLLLIGNSITVGVPSPGFRQELRDLLDTAPDFYTMVGSSGTAPLNGHFDSGRKTVDFYPASFGNGWGTGFFDTTGDLLEPNTPDIAVVHVGTNDVNSDPGPFAPYSNDHGANLVNNCAGQLGEYLQFLRQWGDGTSSFDLTRVVLSLIIPIENRTADVEAFNEAIIALSEDLAEGADGGTPIQVALADHYGRFIGNPNLFTFGPGDWMLDSLHPNADGNDQMADVYRDAILECATDVTPPDAIPVINVLASTESSIGIGWTAPGDDGGGGGSAAFYDVRYSTTSINSGNFAAATQATGEPRPGSPGSSESFTVDGLLPGTTYFIAVKTVDDGGNRSGILSTASATTVGAGGDIVDDFNRPGPGLGPNWAADPEYQIIASELANTSTDNARIDYVATFTAVANPLGVEFTWSPTADAAGRNQAGLALRLDGPSPDASGYLLYRDEPENMFPNQWNLTGIIAGDVGGGAIAQVPSNNPGPPQAGDSVRVLLSSDGAGHHFDILVNGAFDTRLTDPGKVAGNAATWYVGYMSRGALNNNIDDFTLIQDTGPNLPPAAFDLLLPADGITLATTMPFLDWEDAFDPDPGDVIAYELEVSSDPGFPGAATTTVSDIPSSGYTWTQTLQRDTTYYWRVTARDLAGAQSSSNQTFSFFVPNLLSIVDDFERADLGASWAITPGEYAIESGELANTNAASDFTLAMFADRSNPTAVAFTMGAGADSTGFDAKAGFALRMDAASPVASGYMVYRNWSPFSNWQIVTLAGGTIVGDLPPPGRSDATLPPPVAGDEIRIVLSSDGAGHHFDIFVNGTFDTRVTDPDKLFGNAATLYAGYYAQGGNLSNNIDDFTLTGIDFNSPPGPFDLVGPPDGTLVVSLAPTLSWTESFDPNPDDEIAYVVLYDTDPALADPDSLPPTTNLSTPFTGPLAFGESYYWRVRARDLGGESVLSTSTWSFSIADTLSVVDDFNRPGPELGPNWQVDSGFQIANDEMTNASSSGFDLAIYGAASNPNSVQFTWGQSATATGIQRGGMALMMASADPDGNGYYLSVDPISNSSFLSTITGGAVGLALDNASGMTGAPGSGARFRVALTSDPAGHHFDVFINDNFHSRLSDPNKLAGNGPTLYAGAALRGGQPNNIDDFTLTAFNFGPPPTAFRLLDPVQDAIDVPNVPTLAWESAGGPGLIYVAYVGTDSTLGIGAADSMSVQGDTTLVWTSLPLATDLVWRVRVTDGASSRFNENGWGRFRTSATPVELARLEAIRGADGEVAIEWETSFETNHLGFHVWRSEEDDGEFDRLTEALVGRVDPNRPFYRFVDASAPRGVTVLYRLEALDRAGGSEFFGPVAAAPRAAPAVLALRQNRPNPFNPFTTIQFELPVAAHVELTIFDVAGRAVRRLIDEPRALGVHQAEWHGLADGGRPVGSGTYFYRLRVGEQTLTRKMLLVR